MSTSTLAAKGIDDTRPTGGRLSRVRHARRIRPKFGRFTGENLPNQATPARAARAGHLARRAGFISAPNGSATRIISEPRARSPAAVHERARKSTSSSASSTRAACPRRSTRRRSAKRRSAPRSAPRRSRSGQVGNRSVSLGGVLVFILLYLPLRGRRGVPRAGGDAPAGARLRWSSVQAAFTLPGLAGLVLTVGMAVDANVLIYERIREETRARAPACGWRSATASTAPPRRSSTPTSRRSSPASCSTRSAPTRSAALA